MQGILVHGSNHFIVNGPRPGIDTACALIRRWEFPRIGFQPPAEDPLSTWAICTKAFRENLQWAVVLRSPDTKPTPAVTGLLGELQVRGVTIVESSGPLSYKYRK